MRNAIISSFFYVLACFVLIGMIPALSWIGFSIAGQPGALCGGGLGFFIILWATCAFMAAA